MKKAPKALFTAKRQDPDDSHVSIDPGDKSSHGGFLCIKLSV